MMNVLALILVATSLVTAGFWSPPAVTTTGASQKQVVDTEVSEVIVKEGHRVIVVEYDKEQTGVGNTKVSISPPHEGGEFGKTATLAADEGGGGGVKEVICDAFGKCKEVITSVVGGGRRRVGEKVDEVEEEVKDVGDKVVDKAEEVKHGAKEAAVGAKDEVIRRTRHGAEMVKEVGRKGADKAKEGVHSVQKGADKVKETTVENARKGADKAKEAVHDAQQTVTSLTEQAKTKVKEGVEEAAEKVVEKAKAGAEIVKEEGKQELREIYDLGEQLVRHIWSYLAWGRTLSSVMGLVHLLGFSMAYGMAVWVTFVSSNLLSGALPRQQFGVLQSKIYPVYFRAMGYCVGMSLLGHLLGQGKRLWAEKAEMFQGYNLAFAFGMVMINLHYLEPLASKVMFERMREEKEEGRGRDPSYSSPEPTRTTTAPTVTSDAHPTVTGLRDKPITNDKSQDRIFVLSQKLKKLNSRSSLVNILSLMSLTWHLVYLSQLLHAC